MSDRHGSEVQNISETVREMHATVVLERDRGRKQDFFGVAD